MSKRIIVIMYDGAEPSADLIARISAQIKVADPKAKGADAFTYNFDELAAILAKKAVRSVKSQEEETDVIAKSLTVIGRYLADVPFEHDVEFMIDVSNRIKIARMNLGIETNKAFINALDVIDGFNVKMTAPRKKIMEKYKLSKEKLNFIITTYRIYKNGKDLA